MKVQLRTHVVGKTGCEIFQARDSENWISKIYYDRTGEIVKTDQLASVPNILRANAEFGGKTRELNLRVSSRVLVSILW